MYKLHCMPLIVAAIVSTLLIIVLLALGVPVVIFPNALLTFALIGIFAIALIASENAALHFRVAHIQPGEEAYGCRRLHWHHKLALWIGILLLFYVLLLVNFIVVGVLVLGLIPLWILSFLLLSAVIILL